MFNSVKKIYAKIPVGVKASVWFTICSFLQKGIQLITVPLFTRLLSTEQYGEFCLYQSWLGIILIIGSLNLFLGGFGNGMLKYEINKDTFISSMQGLSTCATCVLILIFIINKPYWIKILGLHELAIWFILLEVLFYPSFQYWAMRQRYEYKYKMLVAVTLFIAVMNPLIGYILVLSTVEKGLARIISVSGLNIAVGALFYAYNIKKGHKLYVKEYWKYALAFNIPLIPHYLSSIVLAQSDRIMIEKMFDRTSAAIYSVAYAIGIVMTVVISSINASFVPWTYQTYKRGEFGNIGKMAYILLALIGGISLIPIVVAPEIVAIMAPPEYKSAMWIIPPVAIAGYCTFIYTIFANIEFYHEESVFVMVASCIAAITNIILNYILMKFFGYIAAAYTTVFCYALLGATHYFFMRKILKKHKLDYGIYDIKIILFITLGLIICALFFMALYNFLIIRYLILLVVFIVGYFKRDFVFNILKILKSK